MQERAFWKAKQNGNVRKNSGGINKMINKNIQIPSESDETLYSVYRAEAHEVITRSGLLRIMKGLACKIYPRLEITGARINEDPHFKGYYSLALKFQGASFPYCIIGKENVGLFLRDMGVENPSQLAGKKVGVFSQDIHEYNNVVYVSENQGGIK
jgi:hypothetical protein